MNLDFSKKKLKKEDLRNLAFQFFYNLSSCYKYLNYLGISSIPQELFKNKNIKTQKEIEELLITCIKIKDIEQDTIEYKKIIRRLATVIRTADRGNVDDALRDHIALADIFEEIQKYDGNAGRIGSLFIFFLEWLKKNDTQIRQNADGTKSKINFIIQTNTIKYIFEKSKEK